MTDKPTRGAAWERVLTPEERAQLAESGNPLDFPESLIRYYPLLEALCDLDLTEEGQAFIDRDMRAMERSEAQRTLKPFRHHRRKSHGLTKGFHHKYSLWADPK